MVAPRLYDRDTLVPAICARLAEGEPLAVICRDIGISRRTVNQWRQDEPEIAAQFDEARDDGYDTIAYRTRETVRGRGESTGDVQRDKLIVDNDHKLLAKWDKNRYGDKVQQEITGKDGAELKFMLYVPEKQ